MEREELEKLKQNINKELEYMISQRKASQSTDGAYSIAISNLYIALTNLTQ